MASKKEILAQFASHTGLTKVLEALPGRASLLILNYHRVGDPSLTPYDPGLYSCSATEFDWQIEWLKQRFAIINLDDAIEIVHGRTIPSKTSILLTFDDGYRDNYVEAFPVLRKHGVSATFFLPTLFVGSHLLPWWDEIAYLVKGAKGTRLTLNYPDTVEFDLTIAERSTAIFEILRFFMRAPKADTERFLCELEAATGVMRPSEDAARCFMNWDEAREMQAAGMCFGSHTHTHEILGRLPYERQVEELRISRQILEKELGREIDTLAYPRGRMSSFSDETVAALRETNYKTAFSFYSGINKPGTINPFDVLREAVEMESRSIFRLRHAAYATMGHSMV